MGRPKGSGGRGTGRRRVHTDLPWHDKPGYQRAWSLKKRFGLTLEIYNRMLADQGGACAICREIPTRSLQVDHDHRSNKIRGLLCWSCNISLGYMKDQPGRLRAAAEYLEHAGA